MTIDITKTYQTRDGLPVLLYMIHASSDYPVHGAYQTEPGIWQVVSWTLDGKFSKRTSDLDIFEVIKPKITTPIDITKSYTTRDGHPVRFYADTDNRDYPIHGAYLKDKEWQIGSWTSRGKWRTYENDEYYLDLVEEDPKPIVVEKWINIYGDIRNLPSYKTILYQSEQLAKQFGLEPHTTVPVRITYPPISK